MNDNYYYKYEKLIEPLYGEKRNMETDTILLENNILPHDYNINERVDMTTQDTYSIDPEGCEDQRNHKARARQGERRLEDLPRRR